MVSTGNDGLAYVQYLIYLKTSKLVVAVTSIGHLTITGQNCHMSGQLFVRIAIKLFCSKGVGCNEGYMAINYTMLCPVETKDVQPNQNELTYCQENAGFHCDSDKYQQSWNVVRI